MEYLYHYFMPNEDMKSQTTTLKNRSAYKTYWLMLSELHHRGHPQPTFDGCCTGFRSMKSGKYIKSQKPPLSFFKSSPLTSTNSVCNLSFIFDASLIFTLLISSLLISSTSSTCNYHIHDLCCSRHTHDLKLHL